MNAALVSGTPVAVFCPMQPRRGVIRNPVRMRNRHDHKRIEDMFRVFGGTREWHTIRLRAGYK